MQRFPDYPDEIVFYYHVCLNERYYKHYAKDAQWHAIPHTKHTIKFKATDERAGSYVAYPQKVPETCFFTTNMT